MLNYVIMFFILAVLTADFADIAKFIAGIFVLLFVASLIYSIITDRKVNSPL